MVCVDIQGTMFNYRVAGIAVREGRVLLHRAPRDGHYSLPGGRVEIGEESDAALLREMEEETGQRVELLPLRWICENFFTHEGRRFHELCLYYGMAVPERLRDDFMGIEAGKDLEYRWVPIAGLGGLRVYPLFLQRELESPDLSLKRFVERK